jgi:hypothetical protein
VPSLGRFERRQALFIGLLQEYFSMKWSILLLVLSLSACLPAVQHGVGVAKQLLAENPTPEQAYLGQRALRYFNDPNWARYGVAWGDRVRRIESEASA